MTTLVAFSGAALRSVIDAARLHGLEALLADRAVGQDTASIERSGRRFFVDRHDGDDERLAVIDFDSLQRLSQGSGAALARVLERVDRVLREFQDPPVQLPPGWHKYQHNSLIAFFALPRQANEMSMRWIAEHLGSGDVCFWEVTSKENEVALADYVLDHDRLTGLRQDWAGARIDAQALLPPALDQPQALRPSVDLVVVGSGAVSRNRPYSLWIDDLTPQQREVIHFSGVGALKVRGPAGTGKTLTLQLKALHDIYEADDAGDPLPRVLYLTHSWALADLVVGSLGSMDERGLAASAMEVMPLDWVREELYGDLPEGVEILGEDSIAGRQRQLGLVSEAIDDLVRESWASYRDRMSEDVRRGAESAEGTPERILLSWNIVREIAETIDARGLKPSLNSLQRYVELGREPWMVSLPERADREFVYAVYRTLLSRLQEEGQLTADQALDDFRRYLESYAWNLRRGVEGYDLILIDEFHLFTDTERYLVHLLTRDPELPPRLVLALDPYQSIFTLLTGLDETSISRAARESRYETGRLSEVDLRVVHRFSGEVLRLVKHVHEAFPNLLDVGDDWLVDVVGAESRRAGDLPRLTIERAADSASVRAIELARDRNSNSPSSERTALIAAGSSEFLALQDLLAGDGGVTMIQSREDLDQLSFSRRSIIVTSAEFSAGLQFSHVVVLAFADRGSQGEAGSSAARAALSELYLAITRAEDTVDLVTTANEGQIGDLMRRAAELGIVQVHP